MNEWERVEKERKLREQAEATGAFINMMLDELTELAKIVQIICLKARIVIKQKIVYINKGDRINGKNSTL